MEKQIKHIISHPIKLLSLVSIGCIFVFSSTVKAQTDSVLTDSTIINLDTSKVVQQVIKTDSASGKSQKIIVELVDPEDYKSWDYTVFRSINYSRSRFKNSFFPITDKTMFPVTVLLPISTFAYGRAADKTYDENTGYLLTISQIINTSVTFGIKMLVKRKRVRVYFLPYGIYPRVYTKPDPYSFPSGHTSAGVTSATMFALRYPQYPLAYVPLFTWAAIVGYGRIYLGMHYPSDVLVGAFIGAGSSVLIYSLRKEFFKFKNNVLKENKDDNGSIKGGTVSIFASCLLVSIIYSQIFKNNKVTVNASPLDKDKAGFNLNINYKF